MKRGLTPTVVLLVMVLSAAAAYADTLTFTLIDPTQAAQAGSILTYSATVSAPSSNDAAVYLNGDSFNTTSPITLDDTDFFANAPLFLDPGDSFTFDLFTLTLPASTSSMFTYPGNFTLLGGADGSAEDALGTANFTVAITPEPSTFLLLGTGLLGGLAALKKGARWSFK